MSATHRTQIEGTEEQRFVPTGEVVALDDERLREMAQPRGTADDDERLAFAVAYREGVFQDPRTETEFTALGVLYLTSDGEEACEKWVREHTLRNVDRGIIVAEDALEPTGENGRRYAPIVREHPEVSR